jgi:membrane-associated phospholipid phosphatase
MPHSFVVTSDMVVGFLIGVAVVLVVLWATHRLTRRSDVILFRSSGTDQIAHAIERLADELRARRS